MRNAHLALALCLGTAPLAYAAPSSAQSNASTTSTIALLRQADAAYDVSDYGSALSLYQAAYRQTQEPTILNNVARVQARLGRWQDAVDTWQRFLERMPSAPNRVQVEASIRDAQTRAEQARLEAERQRQIAVNATQPAVNATQRPAASSGSASAGAVAAPRSASVPVGAWVTVGVGGAAAVGGAVLLGLYAGAVGELQLASNCAPDGAGGFNCEPSAQAIHGRAQTMGTAGAVVLSVGGAAVVGGVVWAIVGRRTERSVSAWITPNGVVVGGRF